MTTPLFLAKGIWPNGLNIVRILTAIMLFPFGAELLSAKSMNDLIGFLTEIKFPLPAFFGYTAKIIELGGSILLALGLFTRYITPLIAVVMAGVIYTMNGGNIFNGNLPFLFALLCALFFFTGAGKWSLDYWLFSRKMATANK